MSEVVARSCERGHEGEVTSEVMIEAMSEVMTTKIVSK